MTLLLTVIVVALVFEYINGFHDTANSIATVVSTKVLTPRQAVVMAAGTNLLGALWGTAVAKTIASGLIETKLVTLTSDIIICALVGAIVWNLLTWWFGLPSSSSHALIGGLIGAALVQSGEAGVQWHDVVHSVLIPAVWAPAIAFGAAFLLLLAIYWGLQWLTPGVANRSFRHGQLLSGTWVAFTHGSNDAQKTMGVIALALYSNGSIDSFYIPTWVKVAAGVAIAAGTYAGGYRIMRTLGQRVFQMDAPAGFAAQLTAGAVIWGSTKAGYPLSTTHVVSGAVMGSGATKRLSAVRWGVAGNILVAWVLTIPAAAAVSALVWFPVEAIF